MSENVFELTSRSLARGRGSIDDAKALQELDSDDVESNAVKEVHATMVKYWRLTTPSGRGGRFSQRSTESRSDPVSLRKGSQLLST